MPDDLPAEAITAAENTLRDFLGPWLKASMHGTTLESKIHTAVSIVVRDAAPVIRAQAAAAERGKIRQVIDPGKVEWMIHAFDLIDKLAASRGMDTSTEVQDDLRKLADLLREDAPPAADPTTETEGFRAYQAGLTAGAAAERERIRQLAVQHRAWVPGKKTGPMTAEPGRFFADLLREDTP